MAEPTQFTFELQEVITALIQKQGLHKGIWAMTIEFGLGAGNFGPTPEEARPSAFVQVTKFGLTRTDAEGPLAIDAAKINPDPAKNRVAGSPTANKVRTPLKVPAKPRK